MKSPVSKFHAGLGETMCIWPGRQYYLPTKESKECDTVRRHDQQEQCH